MGDELQVEYDDELVVQGLADVLHEDIKYLLCWMCGTSMTPAYAKLNARELAQQLIIDGHRPQFTQKLSPEQQMADFIDPAIRMPKLARLDAANPRAAGNYVEQVANRLARATAYHDINSLNPSGGVSE